MKVEHILTTIIVTLVISFVSWTGLQIIDNAQGVTRNDERTSSIKEVLTEIKLDVRYIREKMK